MSRLGIRVVKLEDARGGNGVPTHWALLRWRHPEHERQGRQWGWDLRDRLGIHVSELLALVTNEGAGDEPEVIVAPQLPEDMSGADLEAVADAADAAGPWWLLTIHGAYVHGDPMPQGMPAFIEEGLGLIDEGGGR